MKETRLSLVELRGIARRFGASRALDGVDLAIAPGEAVGLVGDNGAGKSTLVGILAGALAPDAGTLAIDGRPARFRDPAEARAAGIETVHQDLALADNLTASANVFLGREIRRRRGPFRVLDQAAMDARAGELLAELKSGARPGDRVRSLSGGERQAVAVARIRLARARLVLMDEPTAAAGPALRGEVLNLVRRLRAEGVAVVLVGHDLDGILAVCDRVAVLRQGRKIADRPAAGTSAQALAALVGGAPDAA